MGEFPEAMGDAKSLCLKIRTILFGDTSTATLGTPAGTPDQLYRPVLGRSARRRGHDSANGAETGLKSGIWKER